MEELIKREDAIKAVAEWEMYSAQVDSEYASDDINEYIEDARELFKDIPAVEQKQGEWIKHDEERDYCSACKHIFKTRTLTKQDKWTTYVDDLGYNFCPNCGARLIGT